MNETRIRSQFAVPGINCGHCKASIEAAVSPLVGVAHVDVDVDRRTVVVDHDPAIVGLRALIDAIEGQGYGVGDNCEGTLP